MRTKIEPYFETPKSAAPAPEMPKSSVEASPVLEAAPGIMPDHWIRDQAERHQMIFPFAEKQNREKNGQKIISYGLSSYGYDARCF